MSKGRVLVANHQGDYVIKLTGDVRMTLCTTIDACLNDMLDDPDFSHVVVDVSEAEGLDSTSLGMLAKISRVSAPVMGQPPVLVSQNTDITKVIDSMGFRDRVYTIANKSDMVDAYALQEANLSELDEHSAREQVLEAHKILMSLNEQNRIAFTELVECIENQPK
ncbi:STAS domain-containing protein [Reinekea thalattae]|uniref:STAS domain-containing protein n=1 Tax=Reinekea thalattae TaxID=2593301 RepID=A0A5C8Z7C8_9GAMM|nr:STAS domain-containing protein [Reinekea thalattae]TXR53219.1 STAS domain-containing protein [Reinekea thalattae]